MRNWTGRFACGVAILSLAMAGCSSSTHGHAANNASSTTGNPRADQATASRIVLAATDLPGNWARGPVAKNDKTGDAATARCLGIPDSSNDETAYAGSPTFEQGSSLEVSSQTVVYTSAVVVQSDLRGSSKPQLATCLAKSTASEGAKNVQITSVPIPTAAGSLSGFQVIGSFDPPPAPGTPPHVVLDTVGLAQGRIEVTLNALTGKATFPPGLIAQATAALAQRLQQSST